MTRVLLFCNLGTEKTMSKMCIISWEPHITPEIKFHEGYPE